MGLICRMSPEEGGSLLLDGSTYDPRIPYQPGEQAWVMIRPSGGYQFAGWSGDVPAEDRRRLPLPITIAEGPQEIVANFVAGVHHQSELIFDSDFENGNGILRYNQRANRALVIEPRQINDSTNIWWHFKIHGITPGEYIQLHIVHSPITEPEFAGDCHPVYSYDGVTWHRFCGAKSPFIQRFDAPSVEICRNIPYPYGKTLDLAEAMHGPYVQASDLATSEEGRAVKMLRLTDPAVPDEGKRVIWMMARQHAFESHSSWYAEYFARWAASDDPPAADLRRRAIIYVAPMMDVDNVAHGSAGKEQMGADGQRADFNRSWGDRPAWAAVRAAKRLLERLKETHDIAAFLDMHNPWYPNTPSWHLPPSMREEGVRFAETWSAELEATGTGIRWKHRIAQPATGAKTISREPSLDKVSSGEYAARTLFERPEGHLCITIETAHWLDGYGNLITLQSLQAYALALGRALNRFLAAGGGNP